MSKLGLFSDPIIVDDLTLYRAIAYYERVSSFLSHSDNSESLDLVGLPADSTSNSLLKNRIVDNVDFQILTTNVHLRTLLKDFLLLKLSLAEEVSRRSQMGPLARITRRNEVFELDKKIAELKPKLDKAYRRYELLRKLTVNENLMLVRSLD